MGAQILGLSDSNREQSSPQIQPIIFAKRWERNYNRPISEEFSRKYMKNTKFDIVFFRVEKISENFLSHNIPVYTGIKIDI